VRLLTLDAVLLGLLVLGVALEIGAKVNKGEMKW
jgi:hypothetical protein